MMNRRAFLAGLAILPLTAKATANEVYVIALENRIGRNIYVTNEMVRYFKAVYKMELRTLAKMLYGTQFCIEPVVHGKTYRVKTNDKRDNCTISIVSEDYTVIQNHSTDGLIYHSTDGLFFAPNKFLRT